MWRPCIRQCGMRETNAVCGLPGCLWASSSGDRLLVALPYKWDMSQAKVHANNHLFKPNALLQFFERTWHQSLFLEKGFHTCLGVCTPVAFVTMPAGSSDSLCYDLRHNMSFDDRIQFPPWCSRVPNTMVPLILAGVDLNTFGFRRVFSFTSPCHWRYCPLSPEARPCQCTKSRVHNTIWNQIHLPAALCHHDSIFDTLQRKTFPSAPSLLVHRLHWLVWFGASQDIPFHWYFRIVKTNAFLTTDNRDV